MSRVMTNLPIITLNDPLLRTRSEPIERVDDELCRLADDMLETLYEQFSRFFRDLDVQRRNGKEKSDEQQGISESNEIRGGA